MTAASDHREEANAIVARLAARYTLAELRRIEELALIAFGTTD